MHTRNDQYSIPIHTIVDPVRKTTNQGASRITVHNSILFRIFGY